MLPRRLECPDHSPSDLFRHESWSDLSHDMSTDIHNVAFLVWAP